MIPTNKFMLTAALALALTVGRTGAEPEKAKPAAEMKAPEKAIPDKPPLPEIEDLRVIPAKITLEDGRDTRRVLVEGQTKTGEWLDLTPIATYESKSPSVEVDDQKYLHAKAEGKAEIEVFAAGKRINLPVEVKSSKVPPVRFVRDVMPVISKVGCNAGTCHGAAKGKNGFKLSLRGYDPNWDYHALIEDVSGRRFNRAAPDQSLMLLKPTAQVPHEGKHVLDKGSRYYSILEDWIARGTETEETAVGRATSVEILPEDAQIALPGMTRQVLVLAHYADGMTRDVTRDAIFTSNITDVAVVSDQGLVTAVRRGEAAVLVRYEGCYGTKAVTVMGDRSGFEWKQADEANYIDKYIDAKLQKMKILPSETCSDAEFIRRVSLDLTGVPPTPEKTRAFLWDETPTREKRERLVDDLILSKDYVENWTNKWADLLQCNSTYLGEKGVLVFRRWIKESIERNVAYDEFVRTLITSQGSVYKNPPANYYRILREPSKATENVSQLFLGVRFSCAKCHDHPFEKWTQTQYYQFGAFFSRLAIKKGQTPDEEVVYTDSDAPEYKHLRTGMDVSPTVPFGKSAKVEDQDHRRDVFAKWLTSKENPLFATALANRVWSYFMGRGIIEPVDDIRSSNPPSNPELLEALGKDFVANNYDMKYLMRTICLSNTYQRSIMTNKWNGDDKINFAHAVPRRLSAEQMLDAIAIATGEKPKFEGVAAGTRAAAVPKAMVAGDTFLALFGRPKRETSCECERTSNVSLAHALNLINGSTISESVTSPNGRITQLANSTTDEHKLIQEIYLAILCRPPSEKEIASIDLSHSPSRVEGAQDLAWALLNSPSFLFNR